MPFFRNKITFRRIDEKEFDMFIRDMNAVLNMIDDIYRFGMYDDSEYVGDYDEPAGIIKGELTINIEAYSYADLDTIYSAIRETAAAYKADEIAIDY